MEAITLSLEYLCLIKGMNIMGLIGTNVLKYYMMTIDFDASESHLHKVNNRSEMEQPGHAPDVSFAFRWRGRMPIISKKVGSSTLILGLDTGAGINVLDQQKGELLADHLTLSRAVPIIGLDAARENLQSGLLHSLVIDDYNCQEIRVVLTSTSRFGEYKVN
ncbi:hypothetical protein CRP01_33155 [Flavilitoribacter nigricans DSM 23189 = NBRC 102662]|uniref:Peptidase A2 domain-containing protein n=1 Tax=Flavilitoribacter nigricans (strain ATCC 23147 / DSM 23189 / NBRC 102662 / NCIMB 1420 / SS-2) TaxID=1122177 RepID=A0A2D0N1E2_FLAN2|nr:hypothetical protein CRP01_33155 [Flavilitoribacter nigricans DSM 23189 = NBRC 102662]